MKLNFYLRGLGIGMIVTALLMGIGNDGKPLSDAQIRARAAELGMVDEAQVAIADNAELTSSTKKEEKSTTSSSEKVEDTKSSSSEKAEDTKSSSSEKAEDTKSSSSEKAEDIKSSSSEKAEDTKSSSSEKAENTKSSSSEKIETPAVGNKDDEKEDGQAPDKKVNADRKETDKETEVNNNPPKVTNAEDGKTITITIMNGQSSTSVANALAAAGLVDNARAFDEFLCSNGYDRKITTGNKMIPVGASPVEIAGILTVR